MTEPDPRSLRSRWLADGCLFPLPAITVEEAEDLHARVIGFLARATRTGGITARYQFGPKPHLMCSAVQDLMRHERLLDLASTLLSSQELAVWQTSVFVRPPGAATGFGWHQDALDYQITQTAGNAVRLWVALTPCTPDNGTMEFALGTHNGGLMRHEDRGADRGHEIAVDIGSAPTRRVVLSPGQLSAHDLVIAHRSHGNATDTARVNIAIDYISPAVMPLIPGDSVSVVRGDPESFPFRHEPAVDRDMSPTGVRALAVAMSAR